MTVSQAGAQSHADRITWSSRSWQGDPGPTTSRRLADSSPLHRAGQDAGNELGLMAAQYMESGQLVPDELVVGIVDQRLQQQDCQNGYLLDGFPRTVPQADSLSELLQQRSTKLDLVLELNVAEEELIERLLQRKRPDDTRETIAERLQVYQKQTSPLLEYYSTRGLLASIVGQGTSDEVYERLREALQQHSDNT